MAPGRALHVFLVAGEVSGDRLGGPLMAALKDKAGGRVRFSGVGGPEMAAQGLQSLFPIETTAIMGLAAIPARLATYLRRIRETADAVIVANPDVLVIIDSPEFTHRVAKRVRKRAPNIPIIDYVAPSVWAWRPWRARAMRRYVDRVLALLPFEPAALARLGGPPCDYVGHPISERVDALRPNATEAQRRDQLPHVILLMPGSRKGELKHMLEIFERTAERIAAAEDAVEFVMPAVPALADYLARVAATWRVPVRVIGDQAEKDAAFRVARAAVVKSGTGTLELAVAGIPMVAAYRVGHIEGPIVRSMINVSSVILANLVLGENVVPQFLQYNATPKKLASAALGLIADGPVRSRQVDAFRRLDAIMEIGTARPSDRAAAIVLDHAAKRSASA
jgi:lipid-A-disaccharide synthase